MPAVGERNVRAEIHRYRERGERGLELPMGESRWHEHRLLERRQSVENPGANTNVPGYSTFRAVLCTHHESGSSMRRVSASAVRVVGCRPSTIDSTISGARKAKRIKPPT